MSWIMRIQNQMSQPFSMYDFPLNEISTLFMPSVQQCSDDLESSDIPYQLEDTTNQDEEFSSTTSMPISVPGKTTHLLKKAVLYTCSWLCVLRFPVQAVAVATEFARQHRWRSREHLRGWRQVAEPGAAVELESWDVGKLEESVHAEAGPMRSGGRE